MSVIWLLLGMALVSAATPGWRESAWLQVDCVLLDKEVPAPEMLARVQAIHAKVIVLPTVYSDIVEDRTGPAGYDERAGVRASSVNFHATGLIQLLDDVSMVKLEPHPEPWWSPIIYRSSKDSGLWIQSGMIRELNSGHTRAISIDSRRWAYQKEWDWVKDYILIITRYRQVIVYENNQAVAIYTLFRQKRDVMPEAELPWSGERTIDWDDAWESLLDTALPDNIRYIEHSLYILEYSEDGSIHRLIEYEFHQPYRPDRMCVHERVE